LKEFIYGIRPVLELLAAGREPEAVLIQRGAGSPGLNEVKAALKDRGFAWKTVPPEKLDRVTRKSHQGVVCYVPLVDYVRTADVVQRLFEEGHNPLVVVLDRITDVRNTGSIARSAAAAGAGLLVLPVLGGARINADAVKASSGALARLPLAREKNLAECLRYLKASGLVVVACTEKGDSDPQACDLTGPVALVLGSEEDGIAKDLLALADARLRIAMPGGLGSLNVAVAAGIMLYEVNRQRQAAG
jgi:23S rRNA (guanosine2251-2'-O)-methyltransferase